MSSVGTDMAQRTLESQWQRVEQMTHRSHLRVFAVQAPVTVFVRGARCHAHIEYHELDQVEIHARLFNAFGLRFVTAQDEAGVYLIIKRRRMLGWLSRAEFTLRLPRYTNLAFNLSPGKISLAEINGILEIPPMQERVTTRLHDHQALVVK